mgnify:CR=1 FL=1
MRNVIRFKDMKFQTTDTIIGTGTMIEGKLMSNTSIRVDGTVRGDIECKGDLHVGENAVLYSDVKAANIYHAGKIHGTVTTTGTLYIAKSGQIYGNLEVAKIRIAEGAVFEGSITMKTDDAKSTQAQKKNDQRVKAVR